MVPMLRDLARETGDDKAVPRGMRLDQVRAQVILGTYSNSNLALRLATEMMDNSLVVKTAAQMRAPVRNQRPDVVE